MVTWTVLSAVLLPVCWIKASDVKLKPVVRGLLSLSAGILNGVIVYHLIVFILTT